MSVLTRVFDRVLKACANGINHCRLFPLPAKLTYEEKRLDTANILDDFLNGQRIEVGYHDAMHLLRGAKALRLMFNAFEPWKAQTAKQEDAVAFAASVLNDLECGNDALARLTTYVPGQNYTDIRPVA